LIDSENQGPLAFKLISVDLRWRFDGIFGGWNSWSSCYFVVDLNWSFFLMFLLFFIRDSDRARATWDNIISIPFLKLP
jgi:hypothetical protein